MGITKTHVFLKFMIILSLIASLGIISSLDILYSLGFIVVSLFIWIALSKKLFHLFLIVLPVDSFLMIDRFSSKYLKFALIGVLLMISFILIVKMKKNLPQDMLVTLSCFNLIFILNTITSTTPSESLINNVVIIFVTSLSLISYILVRQEDLEKIFRLIFIVSTVVSIWGILQYVSNFNTLFVSKEILERWSVFGISGGMDLDEAYQRITGTFFSPNTLGVYLNTILAIQFSLILSKTYTKILNKKIILITFFVNLIALFMTFSRTSWVSLLIALSIIYFIKEKRKFLTAILGFSVIGTLLFFIVPQSYWITKLRIDTGLGLRYYLWLDGYYIFKDYPIFGVGHGLFKEFYLDYIHIPSTYLFEHPHNMLLFMLSEMGLISIVLFIMFSILYFKKLRDIYLNAKLPIDKSIAIGILGMFIVNLCSGLANKGTIIGWSSASFLFWILFGLTYKIGHGDFKE